MGYRTRAFRELALEITDLANDRDRETVRGRIRAFNDQVSAHHREVRAAGAAPLDIFLRDAAGEVLGGLVASTYWDWLDIDRFWLAEAVRGRGIGREMLRLAEEEAGTRGCRHVKLLTFSFQARGFYEKQGYRVVGELTDYPPGASFFWMRKDL